MNHPATKKFPKLRGGTLDSTLKFMVKLLNMVTGNSEITSDEMANGMEDSMER